MPGIDRLRTVFIDEIPEILEDGILEPPRVCRRLIDVSYAAITSVSRAA